MPDLQDDTPLEDLADLYDNAPCGYVSMHADGRMFKANQTLSSWTGLAVTALTSMRVQDLLTVGTRIFYETHVLPVLALQGFFGEVSLDLKRADGTREPVFVNAIERRDERGRAFVRLTLFKAGERRRYEQEIVKARKATDELLALERRDAEFREQFIAVLGHDLRNPLASMSGGARLLKREVTSERGKAILDMFDGSVTRMAGLIDNVMDFARGRLGDGITIHCRPVELIAVLLQVVEELRVSTRDRMIETNLTLTGTVSCDPSRIAQMTSNLLGNALTHGSADQPVRLFAHSDATELVIAVANGGTPIPRDTMERLFHPFFRGEGRHSQEGLGLGLHIASEIAKAHGATLTAESSATETRFTFRMPKLI